MFTFDRTKSARNNAKRPGSNIALAIALMAGSALGVAGFADTAQAQKRDRNAEKEPKADYSKDFVAVYSPISALASGEAADPAAAAARISEIIAAVNTDDDRNAAGGLVYGLGRTLDRTDLQLQGLNLMLESGKHPRPGQLHFSAHQIHRDLEQYQEARASLQSAIDIDYSFEGAMSDGSTRVLSTPDFQVTISELYFDEGNYQGGFDYLQGLIDANLAAGSKPDEVWLRRAFSVANSNDMLESALDFSAMHVQYYPSEVSWNNAFAVRRNNLDLDDGMTLDLMRLVNHTGMMKTGRDYVDYIDSADARRLPGEVSRIVNQAISSGVLQANDAFVAEAKSTAQGRLAADKADLPALESDARKASSTALTATAAGDVFLSYGTFDKAEEMYKIAATKPGADLPRVYTRLGIAQTDLGKIDDAKATFAMVEGTRSAIASLWMLYADSKATPNAAKAAEMVDVPSEM
ncbi:hypothetical protein GCM10023115_17160 [Pontixanthobacter gangjinensis]|uniref:Tetratricopeptide repeat protein n=1 Tax=Pontixanthobacter gangjinensis TaxID=1028742 RepID=A0A6I4SP97_9SPHN|nr:hypothetical protein [Pontixanthobacter gangjinensis]MXO56960.1 hypothetical protein [Pontixanthobacter gangjinensis]